jgi:hypothetical protein
VKVDRFGEDARDRSADVQVRGVGDADPQRNADGESVRRRENLGRADGGEETQREYGEAR